MAAAAASAPYVIMHHATSSSALAWAEFGLFFKKPRANQCGTGLDWVWLWPPQVSCLKTTEGQQLALIPNGNWAAAWVREGPALDWVWTWPPQSLSAGQDALTCYRFSCCKTINTKKQLKIHQESFQTPWGPKSNQMYVWDHFYTNNNTETQHSIEESGITLRTAPATDSVRTTRFKTVVFVGYVIYNHYIKIISTDSVSVTRFKTVVYVGYVKLNQY